MDEGHDLVAHSAHVPPYSTESLISNLGIMIVLSLINLRALIESSHVMINSKIVFWSCTFTTKILQCILLPYVGLPTSILPAAPQCMHTHHFCQKHQLTSPGFKQFFLSQIFLSTNFAWSYLKNPI